VTQGKAKSTTTLGTTLLEEECVIRTHDTLQSELSYQCMIVTDVLCTCKLPYALDMNCLL
jgi:hypothetical protein